ARLARMEPWMRQLTTPIAHRFSHIPIFLLTLKRQRSKKDMRGYWGDSLQCGSSSTFCLNAVSAPYWQTPWIEPENEASCLLTSISQLPQRPGCTNAPSSKFSTTNPPDVMEIFLSQLHRKPSCPVLAA